MQGLVIKNTGSHYTVRTDDGQVREAKARGRLRLRGLRSTNPIAIGDRVELAAGEDTDLITAVHDRKNYVIRRATNLSKQCHILAANVDQCLLIATLALPETTTTFIDRFLASAEAYRIPVVIVFNKTDLLNSHELRTQLHDLTHLYTAIGYSVLHTSAHTGEGLAQVGEALRGKVTLLSGHSGAGKSTLINCLFPTLHLRTAEVSDTFHTGKHTTTFSQMYPLEGDNGYIIDTPGIKGFGTFDMETAEVSHYFREFFRKAPQCRFRGCTHTHEPGCAVREAIAQGDIAESRYRSYLSMLEDKDEDRYRSCR